MANVSMWANDYDVMVGRSECFYLLMSIDIMGTDNFWKDIEFFLSVEFNCSKKSY